MMDINTVLKKLEKFEPLSIFIYGSQATGQTNSKSDYEIGVIFCDEKYVPRNILRQEITDKKYSIFPFKFVELISYKIDTPFEKIYTLHY